MRKVFYASGNRINDGEFGKTISWSRYVVERLSGVAQQPVDGTSMPAGIVGQDRREFVDFYRDYDGTQKFLASQAGKSTVRSSTSVTGSSKGALSRSVGSG
jgi:hypothetical protein